MSKYLSECLCIISTQTSTKVIGFLVYWPHQHCVRWMITFPAFAHYHLWYRIYGPSPLLRKIMHTAHTAQTNQNPRIAFIASFRNAGRIYIYVFHVVYIRFSDDSNAIKLLACMWSNRYRISIFVLCSSVHVRVYSMLPQAPAYWNNIIDQPLI